MEGEAADGVDAGAEGSAVVSGIDRSGAYHQFVIHDPSHDDRWLGIRKSEALALRRWR